MTSLKEKVFIAIADDHELFRAGMIKILQDHKNFHVIIEAQNGKTLIERITDSPQLPDIVLLDLKMPEMDGFETASYLIDHFPSIKIIVLTMHDSERHILRMIELGANGYLFKNTHPLEVAESIEQVYENDYYFNNQINNLLQKVMRYKGKSFKGQNLPIALTLRENEVLKLICKQHTTIEIAEILCLSTRTIEGHRQNLISKLDVRNVAGLVVYAMKHGLAFVD